MLKVSKLTKRFPGVLALDRIDLHVEQGEVLALIGENGAGKSTLMKILAGVQSHDSGKITLHGNPISLGSVERAQSQGIALIHQELNLSDNLDVGANIFLGREPLRWGLVDKHAIRSKAAHYLEMVGLTVSPETLVRDLTIGHQQMVEIAKALSIKAKLLIMDEPTSSLSSKETEALFTVVDQLRASGVSVIYISHRLGEVKRLADRVSVFRDGENAGELDRSEISHNRMVSLMVGRDISQFYSRTENTLGDVILEARDLVTPANPRHRLSFSVRSGEIVGIAGLVGAGRSEVLETLFGVTPAVGGDILVQDKVIGAQNPIQAIQAGIALVPEDRKQQGLVVEMPVNANVSLASLYQNRIGGFFMNRSKEREDTKRCIDKLNVKTPSADQITQYLSGGNQQKVVLGKWLALEPRVLLLDEPTRGIDIGAKQEIYHLMEELASEGVAILFVSSEMEEIIGMSDRALVMHEGRIAGQLSRSDLTEEAIMQFATGQPSLLKP